jgi:hypothetical protein
MLGVIRIAGILARRRSRYVALRTITGGKHLVDKHGHAPHIRGADEPLEA